MQGYEVTQASASYPLVFLMISSTDHINGATGLVSGSTLTVTISKNGGAFASPAGAVTEISGGWYKIAGNATDTATLGPLILHATGTGADPQDAIFPVIKPNPQLGDFGIASVALPTSPVANSIGEAWFVSDIQAGRVGTAQAGASATITLDSGASATDGNYNGFDIFLFAGTGGGIRGVGQRATITGYVGSTKVATVDHTWATTPDNTTQFMILPAPKFTGLDWSRINAPSTTQGLTNTSVAGVNVASVNSGVIAADVLNASQASYVLANSIGASISILPGSRIQQNVSLPNFEFPMFLAGTKTPNGAGPAVTATRSLGGAAFGACANSATHISNGIYTINLDATDLNAATVTFMFTASGCDPTIISFVTQA